MYIASTLHAGALELIFMLSLNQTGNSWDWVELWVAEQLFLGQHCSLKCKVGLEKVS